MPIEPALRIQELNKTYKGGNEALKGVSLDVGPGEFFALLGPNGAGKSTIIGIVCSLVKKSSGTVSVFGHDLDSELEAAKSCIGVVPQEFNFNMFESVHDIVLNQAGYYGIPPRHARIGAEHYLRQLGLWQRRDQPARALSGGMKRRLMIARALVHEPRLLILDEPTAGVDIELRRSMWAFLRRINEEGTTIILTTHYLEEAENLCESIAIIDHGRIVEDTDMKSLLLRLNTETFVLDLRHALAAPPAVEDYRVRLADPTTLEVDITREQNVNRLFAALSEAGIEVLSLRNKANRLEELFLRLVADPQAADEAQS